MKNVFTLCALLTATVGFAQNPIYDQTTNSLGETVTVVLPNDDSEVILIDGNLGALPDVLKTAEEPVQLEDITTPLGFLIVPDDVQSDDFEPVTDEEAAAMYEMVDESVLGTPYPDFLPRADREAIMFFSNLLPTQEVLHATERPGRGENVSLPRNAAGLRGSPSDTCGVDTVGYPLFGKATALQLWQIDGSGYVGFGQYYDAPQDIVVHGVKVYGHVQDNSLNSDTVLVWVKLYQANPVDSMPMGAAVDSAQIAMVKAWNGNNIEDGAYVATFNQPVTMSSAYLVTMEYTGPDTVITLSNSVTNSDGAGENLGFYNYQNTWYRNIDFISFDADWILHPIVEYEFRADFTLAPDTICVNNGDTVCTINQSNPVYWNRMYNQDAANPNYVWDWGDGATSSFIEGCYVYAFPGDYVITLTESLTGWTTTCVNSQMQTLHAGNAPVANFGADASAGTGTVVFTDSSSSNTTSWLYDFGDFAGISTDQNPTYTYTSSGIYNVFLIASNDCGADTAVVNINLIIDGIDDLAGELPIRVFPNPANEWVNVANNSGQEAELVVYDVSGALVSQERILAATNSQINTSEWAAGTYLLHFIGEQGHVVQRLQVVR